MVWTANDGNFQTNQARFTQIAAGLSGSAPLSFETFNGKCYFSNGVDNYASWDGATYTTYPSAPKGAYLRLWKDTMFMAGITSLPDRVYESAAGDAETWPVASWVDIAKGDGDKNIGLGSDGFTLIVFKRNRHMAITDPVTLANRVVDFEKGCESHASIVQFEVYVYFLSRRGICRYLGDSPSEIISFKLDPLFDPQALNLAALNTSWAYTVDNRVCWAVPEVGSNFPTLQIEYYPRLGPLSPMGQRGLGPWAFSRMPARVFTRWRFGNNDVLLGGASNDNKLFWLLAPVGTDDGATFAAILETGPLDFDAPTRAKYIRRIFILGRGKFLVQFVTDFKSAVKKTITVDLSAFNDVWSISDVWGTGTWGPESIIQDAEVNPDLYARVIQMRFTDAETEIGSRLLEVGSTEYSLDAGEWGIYQTVIDGNVLGKRDF
jgi:hypothetical protein